MNYDDDNFWKKLSRRWYYLMGFVVITATVYSAILWITNSIELAIILAIVAFVIWTIIFFVKGTYKEIL
jgi:hypothetical protein